MEIIKVNGNSFFVFKSDASSFDFRQNGLINFDNSFRVKISLLLFDETTMNLYKFFINLKMLCLS